MYIKISPLLMIRLSPDNFKRPVKLFQQNQAHQLVGESHGGKAEQKVGLGEQAGGQPQGTADEKSEIAFACQCQGAYFFRQPFGTEHFPFKANAIT